MVLNFQTIQFKLTFKRKLIDNILILNIVCLLLRQYDAMTIQWDIYWPQNYPIAHYKLGIDTLRKKIYNWQLYRQCRNMSPLLHSDFYLDTFTAGDAMRVPDHGWSLSFDVMNKWQVYMRTYIFSGIEHQRFETRGYQKRTKTDLIVWLYPNNQSKEKGSL